LERWHDNSPVAAFGVLSAVRERRPGGLRTWNHAPRSGSRLQATGRGQNSAVANERASVRGVLREQTLDQSLRVALELAKHDAHARWVHFHAHDLAFTLDRLDAVHHHGEPEVDAGEYARSARAARSTRRGLDVGA
jgi:hypothetical protein